jgi:hypothetical protein
VESIDQRANPAYDLCLGAFPTPPPSVNLETAVTSITYTETVENYRCLWDNFFAAPMTNHISCHRVAPTRLIERHFRSKSWHLVHYYLPPNRLQVWL